MKKVLTGLSATALAVALVSYPPLRSAFAADGTVASAGEPEVVLSPQRPGGSVIPTTGHERAKKYENDPDAIAYGKALFSAFNCSGCHAGGGGGFGPALSDTKWIYGGSMENIVATLYEGRPNGMPPWRGKIPDEQMWQIAAYVKSLSKPGGIAPPL
ncbi:c-type cytochrome [Methylobacterium sp. BTF04]|uniref:c-type cytochrome n=1 Tax=Methylobacterium sp. BTF04 TaxID=2708300 RepID=UPI0013D0A4D4|nr:c-type cytochrome [Methylobacterium sp. BTF04]NEU14529.1 c-type cytochrome [Methylobacterium sp. BTF04]